MVDDTLNIQVFLDSASGSEINDMIIFCRQFDIPCTAVSDSLLKQIDTWKTATNCKDGGEKCLYKVRGMGVKVPTTTTTKLIYPLLTFPVPGYKLSESTDFLMLFVLCIMPREKLLTYIILPLYNH